MRLKISRFARQCRVHVAAIGSGLFNIHSFVNLSLKCAVFAQVRLGCAGHIDTHHPAEEALRRKAKITADFKRAWIITPGTDAVKLADCVVVDIAE